MSRKIKQGFCIFCGNPKLSKEHLWAKRWHDLIGDAPGKKRESSLLYSFDRNIKLWEQKVTRGWLRQGHTKTLQIRTVCIDCNRGWMREVQAAASPFIEALIVGQQIQLDMIAAAKLAAWAAVFATVAASSEENTICASASDLESLRNTRTAPQGWIIGLGYFNDQGSWQTRFQTYSMDAYPIDWKGAKDFPTIQSTTFTIGKSVFYVVINSYPSPLAITDNTFLVESSGLRLISPQTSLYIKPFLYRHTSESCEKIANALNNEFVRMLSEGKKEANDGELVDIRQVNTNFVKGAPQKLLK